MQSFHLLLGILVDKYGLMISDIIKATFRGPIRRSVNKWICSHLLPGDLPKGEFGDSVNGNTNLENFYFNSISCNTFIAYPISTCPMETTDKYTFCVSFSTIITN